MKIFFLIALGVGLLFVAVAGVIFLALLRWLNLVVASWSGPWFQRGSLSVINLVPDNKRPLRRRKTGQVKRLWSGAMREFREVESINRKQKERRGMEL